MSEPTSNEQIHDDVRAYYRRAAADGRDGNCGDPNWGAMRYDDETLSAAPDAAAALSMGCGNPFATADLQPGEDVLDLGSRGGST